MHIYEDGNIIEFEDNSQAVFSDFNIPKDLGQQTLHDVGENETLFSISAKFLKNTSSWYKIAELNNIEDPIEPPLGLQLIIPLNG